MQLSLSGLRRHPLLLAGPAYPELLDSLNRFFEVEVVASAALCDRVALGTCLAGKSALMATHTAGIDAALLQTLPHLKAVCKIGRSHADIDLAACTRANVMATNTPDWGDGDVAMRKMTLAAAANVIAIFGFGREAGHPQNLLNADLRCTLGCCY